MGSAINMTSFFQRKGFSFWAIILIVFVYFSADMLHHKWMKDEPPHRGVIKHDVIGYYDYLPAVFIYGDHKLEFIGTKGFKNENRFMCIRLENGNRLIQYTSGLAVLYTPFFLMAHATAPLFGQERDGFNWVYQFFLVMSALFYVSLGLIFLRKLMLKYFSDLHTALALLLIALGTNLFYYTVYEGPMSHSYSFAFIAIFLYLADRWYRSPGIKWTALLGIVYGMTVLIRPTNAIVLIMFVFWGIKELKEIGPRFLFLLKKTPLILLMILFFLIPWTPQLLYWKSITGHFFVNSYESVGSAFYFDAPQTHKMLFSYRKGWFIYTPVMFVAIAGFVFLYRKRREFFWNSLLYMIVMIYVLSSWWAWWFGGGFGSRSMVDTYAIMAFPLAAIVEKLQQQKSKILLYSGFSVFLFLVALNWMQTFQYNRGGIHFVSMDKDAYWHNYFKLKGRGVWGYLSDPDHQLARLGIYYYYDWSYDYDAFKLQDESLAKQEIRNELTASAKTMRSIHRYARRNDISDTEALQMVVDRIYGEKTARKNLR